jgi:hypothetical protein
MPKKRTTGKNRASVREPKVAKTYRLSARKIAAAREALGSPTATAAIETALDMVVFRRELVDGTAAMLGIDIADRFGRG